MHALAVPMIPFAVVLALWQLLEGAWGLWWRPVGALTVSYALQWVGHLVEGNDMGELILVKKLLRRPYVSIAPRYRIRGVGGAPKAEDPAGA